MPTESFVSISYRIAGVRLMTLRLFSPVCRVCSTIPILRGKCAALWTCIGVTDTHASPANVEAATLFRENMKEYERRVKVSSRRW